MSICPGCGLFGPCPHRPSVREAARRRTALGGADAQALEGAISLTERERDDALAEVARLKKLIERSAEEFGLARVRMINGALTEHDLRAMFTDGSSTTEVRQCPDPAVPVQPHDESPGSAVPGGSSPSGAVKS